MRWHRSLVIAVAIIASSGWSAAFQCISQQATLVRGSSWGLAVSDDRLAISSGTIVQIFDVSRPEQPELRSTVDLGDDVKYLGWLDDDFLVAAKLQSLEILDTAGAGGPQVVAEIPLSSYIYPAHAFEVDGHIVWLGVGEEMLALDLSEPENPRTLPSRKASNQINGLHIVDGHAYVVAGRNLEVFDLSLNPAAPAVGQIQLSVSSMAIEVVGSISFVSTSQGGLLVVDVSDPSAPAEVALLGLDHLAVGGDLTVRGDALYLGLIDCWHCLSDGGLSVIDISNPLAPVEIRYVHFASGSWRLAQLDSHLVVADHATGLRIMELSSPGSPATVFQRNVTFDEVLAVAVAGNFAYIADRGLRVVDLAGTDGPTIVGGFDDNLSARAIAEDGDLVVVLGGLGEVRLIDIIDPTFPVSVAQIALQPYGSDIKLAGNTMVVAVADELRIFDVSEPSAPTQEALLHLDVQGLPIDLEGGLLFVGHHLTSGGAVNGTGALAIIDISTPGAPVELAWMATPLPINDIAVDGDLLVFADQGGLRAVDIADPRNPIELAYAERAMGRYVDIDLDTGVALIASSPGYLSVVDLTDPSRPRFVGHRVWQPFTIADGGAMGGNGVAMHRGRAVVADGQWGLRILDYTRCFAEAVKEAGATE